MKVVFNGNKTSRENKVESLSVVTSRGALLINYGGFRVLSSRTACPSSECVVRISIACLTGK